MTLRTDRFLPFAVSALSLLFSAPTMFAQAAAPASAPASPYGGQIVEQAVARINDQIVTTSDYDRAMKELDDEARKRGATMQQIADNHKDLLRNLIDQQLWLAKAKELDINVDTEVIKQLDEIRKKYNLETMEDLEKAAKEQGVSYEDFKQNIKNQLMTQEVMRREVGYKVQFTPGEAQRYYEAHKQEYTQPESVHLSEIMVSAASEDAQTVATAKAKADDIVAKLKGGANFDALARTASDGPTAAQGGDMGKFVRGSGDLAKVFEDATFDKPAGYVTDPIRTKQGYVIFKVDEHIAGGVQPYKEVEQQVEDAFYQQRMGPAIREELSKLREESYIVIRPGYSDSAATPNELKPTISYSAYTPPSPKKKKKAQRTRFRETGRTFRDKGGAKPVETSLDTTPAAAANDASAKSSKSKKKAAASATPTTMKPGKREKIRFGQAPRETLPETSKETQKEDAGALPETAKSDDADIPNPLDQKAPEKKTRFAARAKLPKAAKPKGPQLDTFTPLPADSAEVADTQTQSAPLGMNGDTTKKKKKQKTATGEKTRMQQRPKDETEKAPLVATPAAPAQGAPAPKPAPQQTAPETIPPPAQQPQQ
ncbi:MAG TPA: peptidylprolyl isomerase [Acidobacteriaceae bacterium]|nr:peptidylprolyl isomerase [Acidobacteriaceae bacterium]